MNHLGLFEGIGGFSLAAHWMNWKTLAWCEWNEFGQKVLKHHFPYAEGFGDITKTDFKKYENRIDILTGGFPCQPYSVAGLRKGKEDERHLWPEMLRAIKEISPSWVVGENVLGLVNWNGGLVFDEVQADLETQGYKVIPYILPACAVNAPHRRDRVWFVAYNNSFRLNMRGFKGERVHRNKTFDEINTSSKDVANTDSEGLEGSSSKRVQENERGENLFSESKSTRFSRSDWKGFPTQPPICSGDDGVSERLDGITFSKWRTESIKAYGNAIVPQVAFEIFKAIELYECKHLPKQN